MNYHKLPTYANLKISAINKTCLEKVAMLGDLERERDFSRREYCADGFPANGRRDEVSQVPLGASKLGFFQCVLLQNFTLALDFFVFRYNVIISIVIFRCMPWFFVTARNEAVEIQYGSVFFLTGIGSPSLVVWKVRRVSEGSK